MIPPDLKSDDDEPHDGTEEDQAKEPGEARRMARCRNHAEDDRTDRKHRRNERLLLIPLRRLLNDDRFRVEKLAAELAFAGVGLDRLGAKWALLAGHAEMVAAL